MSSSSKKIEPKDMENPVDYLRHTFNLPDDEVLIDGK
jgi:hypothetical protein